VPAVIGVMTCPAGFLCLKEGLGRLPAMFPDIDIWRAALLMAKRYGDDAAVQPSVRADEMLDQGDVDGGRLWQQIVNAIEQLQERAPAEGETSIKRASVAWLYLIGSI